MKSSAKIWVVLLLAGLLLLPRPEAGEAREVAVPEPVSPAGYGSLSELVVLIGEDAARQFAAFFTAGSVRIEPFPVLGEFAASRTTVLGATLGDQMAAVINSVPELEIVAVSPAAAGEEAKAQKSLPVTEELEPQLLRGVLQEIDGYLRVHISGRNGRGQWRSYVANVEMSEAVYRAMHTYVSYQRR